MLKVLPILFSLIILTGCAHCSVTEINFDGNTKGFNPYGDGVMKMKRISFWGTSDKTIRKLIDKYDTLEVPEDN